ncbi:transporter [Stenotrophomonas sp. Betaine-02u-21]|uniref:transporter n=1 Tax=unclassified Stenotrophomonas TaxID=196198 RepID=UPI000C34B18B|nr:MULTISPECIES: transporter [unclassified Stenotrophomonas]PKH72206.1 transporter [Stenotrophomonas sp. Betaine-02u-23]PKH73513.1 transporter [Stenotrophomonas sp. Betaine-02u-21]PKH94928.1 transporter [Stenotrophomonas sp. Bg11-02]
MRSACLALMVCSILFVSGAVQAQQTDEPPSFDRPGIGLGTGIVPRGALALELGLPSHERDRDADGLRTEQLSGEVTLRTGLFERWELQFSGSPWQRQRSRLPGMASTRTQGGGDAQLALKWAPPTGSETDRWALLGSATVARGDAALSEGRQYALAGSYEHDFSDHWTGALYASHSRGDGERSTVWSPSVSLALTPRLSAFVEAGVTKEHGEPRETVAGGGVTWMWTDRVQLDASLDAGLDAHSPDLQAGLGISAYFD